MKTLIACLVATSFLISGCATTCEQRADIWHEVNRGAIRAVEIYAVPHLGTFGPEWSDVTYRVLELAKQQYLEKCLREEKAKNGEAEPAFPDPLDGEENP